MKRHVSFEEISDGKRYKSGDMARISCNDCKDCSECCRFTDDTIHLDPYDIFQLEKGLGKGFGELMDSVINFTVVDGVITPYLVKSTNGACVFLNESGRCSIHDFRPGFCRLFPLGRIYNEDGDFDYFIQVHECPHPSKAKAKISSWIGIPELQRYETFVRSWHRLMENIADYVTSGVGNDEVKAANLRLINTFFSTTYDTTSDFYTQFENKLNQL